MVCTETVMDMDMEILTWRKVPKSNKDYKLLHQIAWQSIQQLLRHFTLNHRFQIHGASGKIRESPKSLDPSSGMTWHALHFSTTTPLEHSDHNPPGRYVQETTAVCPHVHLENVPSTPLVQVQPHNKVRANQRHGRHTPSRLQLGLCSLEMDACMNPFQNQNSFLRLANCDICVSQQPKDSSI